MDNVHIVTLGCHHCHGEHLHEVTYAGRLLASTLCSNCGHRIAKDLPGLRRAYIADVEHRILTKPGRMLRRVIHHPVSFARDLPGLRRAYIADVEHRILTKPGRMLRRVIHHPVSFARGLPGALLLKPAKMEAELRVLTGRR